MDKNGNPEKHKVVIYVDAKGNFRYENGLLLVDRGDTISWECPECREGKNPFTIHFGWDSPLGRLKSYEGENYEAAIPADARPGYYRYTVAVLRDNTIWTDDPELIVKKPPKGG